MAGVVLRGRSRDLAAVETALHRSVETGHGALVVIEGVPGIGKSSVLGAAVELAAVLGFRVGASKIAEIDQIALGSPLLLALRSGREPLVDAATFNTLEPIYDNYVWLVERIAVILERLAAEAPVVLAIDDLHWADRLTRFALHMLPSRLASSPVVWLLTSRVSPREVLEEVVAGAEPATEVIRVHLRPLTEPDVDALAKDRLGVTPVEQVRDMLRSVGGSPFWALQVLDGLAREPYGYGGDGSPGIQLADVLRRRLATVGPGTVALIQLAAVWGRPLSTRDATALLEAASPSGVSQAVREAEANGLLAVSLSEIAVPHDLLREVIYAEIDAATRSDLHRRCARYLAAAPGSAVAAGAHYLAMASHDDLEAAEGLLRAAVDSANAAPEQSADLAMAACARLSVDHPRRLDVVERVIGLLVEVQREADAIALADQVIAGTTDADTAAKVHVQACRALWQSGKGYEAMQQRATAALALSGLTEHTRAQLASVRALAATRTASALTAAADAGAALAEGERLQDELAQRVALLALAESARNVGQHQDALDWLRRTKQVSSVDYLAEEIRALQHLDRYDEADQLLTARTEAAKGADNLLPSVRYAKMWQDHNLGRLDDAENGARTLLRLSERGGHLAFAMNARMIFCAVAIYRGDLVAARRFVSAAESGRSESEELPVARLRATQGWLAAAEGELEESVRILRPLLASAGDGRQSWPWSPPWMRVFALVGLAADDPDVYEPALELAEVAAERNPHIVTFQGVACQVRGLVRSDLADLTRAVALLRTAPRPLLLAGALDDLGQALVSDGRERDGRSVSREGLAIYERVGATGLAATVSVRLKEPTVGAGANRPEGRAVRGLAALTPAELRVARLVAAGHSSRSAAESLTVSVHTVNSQLAAVFSKLEVTSRVQLANLLRDQDRG